MESETAKGAVASFFRSKKWAHSESGRRFLQETFFERSGGGNRTKTMKRYDAIKERGSTPHVIRLVWLRLILEDD